MPKLEIAAHPAVRNRIHLRSVWGPEPRMAEMASHKDIHAVVKPIYKPQRYGCVPRGFAFWEIQIAAPQKTKVNSRLTA